MRIVAQDGRIYLRWPRCQEVPPDGRFNIYGDDQTGDVIYETPLNYKPIPAWPDDSGKAGYGVGGYGEGPYGIGVAGVGYGMCPYGMGGYGIGAQVLEHTTKPLADGTYKVAVVGLDGAGNNITPADVEVEVVVAGTPRPATDLAALAYDKGTDVLTLTWTRSPDDD